MSKEISPHLIWGAGAVVALILGFVIWKFVIAAPRSSVSATPPPGASARAQAMRQMREMRLHGQLPNQKPTTP